MRVAESIQILFSLYFVFLGWLCPLGLRRRIKVTLLGALVVGSILSIQFASPFLRPLPQSVIRDWLPAALLLMAYWQAGQFLTSPNQNLQQRLARFDRRLLGTLFERRASGKTQAFFFSYLELAYLMCYPVVPLGLAALYMAHPPPLADEYWRVVLPSAYLCYAITPFVQTLPPWILAADGDLGIQPTRIRALNLWILRHASIRAITFPSAHVAASTAASLVLLRHVPLAGVLFLWVSMSIAVGAVAGRYHYAVDILLGAAVAVLVFLVAC